MNRLLAYLTSLAVIVVVIELGLRLLGLQPLVTINRFHSKLGWEKTPSTTTEKSSSEFDITYSINSRGLRDDEDVTYEKPPGELRILVVGDSFPLGYTVNRSDLFVDLLEKRLRAEGRKAQVINGGTEGYSTDQEAIWLAIEGLRYRPDLVLVTAYQNDIYWNSQSSYLNYSKPRLPAPLGAFSIDSLPDLPKPDQAGWLVRHSAIGGLIHNLGVASKYGSQMFMGSGPRLPRDEAVVLTPEPEFLGKAWSYTRSALELIGQTCAGARIPLLLVTIPSREQVHPDMAERYAKRYGLEDGRWDPDQPTRKLASMARELGIDVLDPLPAFDAEVAAASPSAPALPLYFTGDWHFNAAGNRVFSNALYDGIVERGLLDHWPADHQSPAWPAAGEASATPSFPPGWLMTVAILWVVLSGLYITNYRDEKAWLAPLRVGALLTVVVALISAIRALMDLVGPSWARLVGVSIIVAVLVFLFIKTRRKIGIIREVMSSFVNRGYWYMIPLLVMMLTIGSLLIVAASSPFIAPFIYTLF